MTHTVQTHTPSPRQKFKLLALVAVAFLAVVGFSSSAQAGTCLLGPEVVLNDWDGPQGGAGIYCRASDYGPGCPSGSNTGDIVTLPPMGSPPPPFSGTFDSGVGCVTRVTRNGSSWADATQCAVYGRSCEGGGGGGQYSWNIGAWVNGACAAPDQQTQTRIVDCRDLNGAMVSDVLCPAPKPATSQTITQSCGGGGGTPGSCGGVYAYEDCFDWPFPSAPELISRSVNCAAGERITCTPKTCGGGTVNAETCSCVTDAACTTPLTYSWETGAWQNGSCAPPDQQTQTRNVVCKDSGGNTVANTNCPAPTPANTQVVTATCLPPPGANSCTSNPPGLPPANRFDSSYVGKECAGSAADRMRVLGTDIVLGGFGGSQPIDFCNSVNATCCEMERMPSPTPCTGRGCVVFQVTAYGPGAYTVQNLPPPGRGPYGDVYATCAGGTPIPGAPLESCVCENYCNGTWTWDGARWFSTDALGNDPDDKPNCRPAPKPQRVLGALDSGTVRYFDGQVTANITPFADPAGQPDWFYFPNDNLGADGSYCVGGSCTPVRYCKNGRDIQLRADCRETDMGACVTCTPGTFCQGGDRMQRAANCAVSLHTANDPTCQIGQCTVSQSCSGPNLIQINSDCSVQDLGPDPSCQPQPPSPFTGVWRVDGACSDPLSPPGNPYLFSNGMINIRLGSLSGYPSCTTAAVIAGGYTNPIDFTVLPMQPFVPWGGAVANCTLGQRGYWVHPYPKATRKDLYNDIIVYNCGPLGGGNPSAEYPLNPIP
jgi:hypothetical protein